jgi:hypothetical protein
MTSYLMDGHLFAFHACVTPTEPQLQSGLKQPTAWYSYAAAALNKPSAPANTAASTGAPTDPTQQQQQQQQEQGQEQQETVLPPPTRRHLLVILSSSDQQQQLACSRVAAAGFDRWVQGYLAGSCFSLSSECVAASSLPIMA